MVCHPQACLFFDPLVRETIVRKLGVREGELYGGCMVENLIS